MKFTSASRLITLVLLFFSYPLLAEEGTHPQLLTYGEMRVAIGQQQHQGRVLLQGLVEREHFYGVGALAGLNGEITICDGKILISTVSKGKPHPIDVTEGQPQATLLMGAYVTEWSEHFIDKHVSWSDFDEYIRKVANQAGIDTNHPFVFRIEGEFQNVRVHIINGGCPVHARIHNKALPVNKQPFLAEPEKIQGTLVGVFAKDAAGQLTHPGTSTHSHLIYKDAESGVDLTGHLEKVGIARGAVLHLPQR